eukprot:TRINITY_DN7521_c0_g1_i1.p1 TRINITY_DN7521_c0_g1~~TRINITY_DN7521_c0_g1_i1.p1  ORF type:complete len:2134 (+),score=575.57 TRINITY_DN7521_c0_g1_i1:94-6495(+)
MESPGRASAAAQAAHIAELEAQIAAARVKALEAELVAARAREAAAAEAASSRERSDAGAALRSADSLEAASSRERLDAGAALRSADELEAASSRERLDAGAALRSADELEAASSRERLDAGAALRSADELEAASSRERSDAGAALRSADSKEASPAAATPPRAAKDEAPVVEASPRCALVPLPDADMVAQASSSSAAATPVVLAEADAAVAADAQAACSSCTKSIAPGAAFCLHCGKKQAVGELQQEVAEEPKPLPKVEQQPAAIDELVAMGFKRQRAMEALDSHGGNADSAIAELLAAGDAALEKEAAPSAGSADDPVAAALESDVQQLQAMGFSRNRAAEALKQHCGRLDNALEALLSGAGTGSSASSSSAAAGPAMLADAAVAADVLEAEVAMPKQAAPGLGAEVEEVAVVAVRQMASGAKGEEKAEAAAVPPVALLLGVEVKEAAAADKMRPRPLASGAESEEAVTEVGAAPAAPVSCLQKDAAVADEKQPIALASDTDAKDVIAEAGAAPAVPVLSMQGEGATADKMQHIPSGTEAKEAKAEAGAASHAAPVSGVDVKESDLTKNDAVAAQPAADMTSSARSRVSVAKAKPKKRLQNVPRGGGAMKGQIVAALKTLPNGPALLNLINCPKIIEGGARTAQLATAEVEQNKDVMQLGSSNLSLQLEKAEKGWTKGKGKLGRVLDAICLLRNIFQRASQAVRTDLAGSSLKLPPLLSAVVGEAQPAWEDDSAWQHCCAKLDEFASIWKPHRADVDCSGRALGRFFNSREEAPDLAKHWPGCQLQATWNGGVSVKDVLLKIVEAWPAVMDLPDGKETPPGTYTVDFNPGAKAEVEATVYEHNPAHAMAFRAHQLYRQGVLGLPGYGHLAHPLMHPLALPNQPNHAIPPVHIEKKKKIDLLKLLPGLLKTIESEWPGVCDDARYFMKMQDLKQTGGWCKAPSGRRTSKSADTRKFTLGEQFPKCLLQAALGLQPEGLLTTLGGPQVWRTVLQEEVGDARDNSNVEGLILHPREHAAEKTGLEDPEEQLQALCSLGVVERRALVTEEEKNGDIGLSMMSSTTKQKRCFWFCEACDKWLDQREASYSNNPNKSAISRHRCGFSDRSRQFGEASTAKPRKFEIVTGTDLGLQIEAAEIIKSSRSKRLQLAVRWPIGQVLRHLEFAAGAPADRLKAFVRVVCASAHDDEAEAEGAEADDEPIDEEADDGQEKDEEGEDEDDGDKAESSSGPASKRRKKEAEGTQGGDAEAEDCDDGAGSSSGPALKRKRKEADVNPKALAAGEGSEAEDQEDGQKKGKKKQKAEAAGPSKKAQLLNTTGQQLQRLQRFSILSCADLPEAPAQPPGFRLPLHAAQRRTLYWMATREGLAVPGFAPEDTAFGGFATVQRIGRRLGQSDVCAQLRVERLYSKAKGGLLADAVGYGKTASILALLSLSRPAPAAAMAECVDGRILSRATLVVVPANLFEQWQKEVEKFLPKDTNVVAIATFKDMKRLTIGEVRKADIVIVSLRLMVSKFYHEHLDALAGMPTTYEVTLSADSRYEEAQRKWKVAQARWRQQMVFYRMGGQGVPEKNKPKDPGPEPLQADFKDLKQQKPFDITSKRLVERHGRLLSLAARLLDTGKDIDALECPALEMFRWQRLVVDELHEPLRAMQDVAGLGSKEKRGLTSEGRWLFHSLETLSADARWGLTATPATSDARQVSFLARFHRVFVPRDSDLEAQHYLDAYVRSNELDVSHIPIKYHLLPVRHTAGERALYLNQTKGESSDASLLLQICNFFSPDGSDGDMSSAIHSTKQENERALDKHRAEMKKAALELEKLAAEERKGFPAAVDEDDVKRRKAKLKRLQDNQPLLKEKERRLESRMKYFEEVLKELKKLDQDEVECPMCMEVLQPDACAVTVCGHLFCKDCITSWVQQKNACPTCTQRLMPGAITDASEVLAQEKESSERGRVSRFGSKIEAVCKQLDKIWQKEPGAKTIIFVQFEVLLKKMQGALKDLGLPCLTLCGTVFERRRVIRQFHAAGKDNSILLLSLERSPAGMNLVCCHHLLLVHPMHAESQDAALGFERQAIGRVRRQGQREEVHVYRFFVRDTVEEELVRKHHQEIAQGLDTTEAASSSGAAAGDVRAASAGSAASAASA